MQHHVKNLTRPNWKRLLLSGYPADPSKGKAGKIVFYTLYSLSILVLFFPHLCHLPVSLPPLRIQYWKCSHALQGDGYLGMFCKSLEQTNAKNHE